MKPRTNITRLSAAHLLFGGAALVMITLISPSAPRAAGLDTAGIKDVATDVLDNGAYQTDLPGQGVAPPVDPPPASAQTTDEPSFSNSPPSQDEPAPAPESAPPPLPSASAAPFDMPHMLLWIAIGGLVVLFCFLLLGYFRRPPNAAPPPPIVTTPEQMANAPAQAVIGPIDDAERLAAAGRYGEAIHVILLRFLGELRHGANLAIADSLTSREILRKATVPPAWRHALGIIIGAVELCHFGGRGADEKLFRHCANAYYTALAPSPDGQPI